MESKQEQASKAQSPSEGDAVGMAAAPVADARTDKFIGVILTRMAAELQEAALIFNQTGTKKVEVTGPKQVAGGETLKLVQDGTGFEFVNHNSDRVQIFEISGDTTSLYAELYPTLDGNGDLTGWKEKQIHAGGTVMDRTLGTLTNSYLMATVQKRLQL